MLNKPSSRPPSPAEIQAVLKFAHKQFEENAARERIRIEKFGKVRAEIATEWGGRTLVAVGSTIHQSAPGKKWNTFPDFLLDYAARALGHEWSDAELKKPFADRHPVIQWKCRTIEQVRKHSKVPGQVTHVPPSNFMAAFSSFANDLYTVDHNGRLDKSLLARVKNKAEFEGARHELFAEATCHRAGFTITHENQKDIKTRHAEFFAIHKATGQEIAVEAKRRRRQPGQNVDFKFERLLNKAIEKQPTLPLVIFLDTNLPTADAEYFFGECEGSDVELSKPMKAIVDRIRRQHGGVDPYSMIVFSNHPHSLGAEENCLPVGFAVSCISQIPARPFRNIIAFRDLHNASLLYYNVPNELPLSISSSQARVDTSLP